MEYFNQIQEIERSIVEREKQRQIQNLQIALPHLHDLIPSIASFLE